MTSSIRLPAHRSSSHSTRLDALPEHHQYHDRGCTAHPACLSCAEPTCLLDYHDPTPPHLHRQRNACILHLHANGYTVPRLSRAFLLSKRTIYRVLSHASS